MGKSRKLPFEVGQLAEARSFQEGYRGAWFQCKIREISWSKGALGHLLEYIDFPDENMEWVKLYQWTKSKERKERKRVLMVRPSYPPIYHVNAVPKVEEIRQVSVIVENVWKVGDLVDWWYSDCFWSGKIIQLVADDKAKIQLPEPPWGEDQTHEVLLKDLRPSLDWSPDFGWTVPTPEEEKGRPCARLIEPVNQVIQSIPTSEIQGTYPEAEGGQVIAESSPNVDVPSVFPLSLPASYELGSSRTKQLEKRSLREAVPEEVVEDGKKQTRLDGGDTGSGKTSWSDPVSGPHVRELSAESAGEVAKEDLQDSSCLLKKYVSNGGLSLNSMHSDTLDAAIVDLEELANKLKWLKTILESGNPLSDATRPQWKFMEHHNASPFPK